MCPNCDRLTRERDEALEDAQYQPEFWAVLRIVSRERDEARAVNDRLSNLRVEAENDALTRQLAEAQHKADAAERQLAESIGKRLQLEDQIAAVRQEINSNGDWSTLDGRAFCQRLLNALPPETARAEEQIQHTGQWFVERQHPEREGFLQVRGPLNEHDADRLLADWKSANSIRPYKWERIEPVSAAVPASPTPTKEPR